MRKFLVYGCPIVVALCIFGYFKYENARKWEDPCGLFTPNELLKIKPKYSALWEREKLELERIWSKSEKQIEALQEKEDALFDKGDMAGRERVALKIERREDYWFKKEMAILEKYHRQCQKLFPDRY